MCPATLVPDSFGLEMVCIQAATIASDRTSELVCPATLVPNPFGPEREVSYAGKLGTIGSEPIRELVKIKSAGGSGRR